MSLTPAAAEQIADAWRGEQVDLELVTRIYREDGSHVEITAERRATVKSTRREAGMVELEVADVDRSALDTDFPEKTYTLEDFPDLFEDHVNQPVPQVIGTALKVPLVYADDTPGAYRYLACEVLPAGAPLVLTVYRAGAIVNPAEYSVDTVTVAGTTYLRLTFPAEQRDQRGSLYPMAADLRGPGSRAASDEIARLLQIAGYQVNSSFSAARDYCLLNRMVVDCGHVSRQKLGVIIADLAQIARAQVYRDAGGAFGIVIDQPRDVHIVLRDRSGELQINDFSWPELKKKLVLEYRPTASERGELRGRLERTTDGESGEQVYRSPYLRDHDAADRFLCYLQRRENARGQARGVIAGVQLAPRELVAIHSLTVWDGWRTFAAPQISRPADANQVTLDLYDEAVYEYEPGELPEDATNGYTPDFSLTKPAAPTGLVVVSQGTATDTDGKTTAFALIRAVPPALNWARLEARVENQETGEIQVLPLRENAGNYEVTFGGLRLARDYEVVAYAVNANGVEGFLTAPVAFESANAEDAPDAPASITVEQRSMRQLRIRWDAVAADAGDPPVTHYKLFKKTGGGGYVELTDAKGVEWIDDNVSIGTAYQYKVRAVNQNTLESGDSPESSAVTPQKLIRDEFIEGQGVGGVSIADGSINRARSDTGATSLSGSIPDGFTAFVTMDVFTFFPAQWVGGAGPNCFMIPYTTDPGNDQGTFGWYNNTGSSQSWGVRYRKFLT